jgi:hypothetical protein
MEAYVANVQHSALTTTELHEPKGAAAASVDTVYIADGAGSGAWAKNDADNVTVADAGGFYTGANVEVILQEIGPLTVSLDPQYGEMLITSNVTATSIAVTNTYYQVTAGTIAGIVDGVTFDTDHLVIGSGGIYELNCVLTFTGQVNDTFGFQFHKDAGGGYVPIGKGTMKHRTSSATNEVHIGLQALLQVNASDKLAVFVRNETTTGNPTISDMSFFMHRIKVV